jgi:tRNA G18 (ribose-2'-O)-methylase SpoU
MRSIVAIAHNLRSTHNVGSLLRTSEGLGVECVYLTGYTPYPAIEDDPRLPHQASKTTRQIAKTALGAEKSQNCHQEEDIFTVLGQLKADGYIVVALEQTDASLNLSEFHAPDKIALIVGREVEGVEEEVIRLCDMTVEIPMFGQKESFNVVQAASMALYHCRFYPFDKLVP